MGWVGSWLSGAALVGTVLMLGSCSQSPGPFSNSASTVTSPFFGPASAPADPCAPYIGTWQADFSDSPTHDYLAITKDGALYDIDADFRAPNQTGGPLSGSCVNGLLHTSAALLGDIAYRQSTNSLLFMGMHFHAVASIPPVSQQSPSADAAPSASLAQRSAADAAAADANAAMASANVATAAALSASRAANDSARTAPTH
jgi:hypothetical protein